MRKGTRIGENAHMARFRPPDASGAPAGHRPAVWQNPLMARFRPPDASGILAANKKAPARGAFCWLGDEDSNLD